MCLNVINVSIKPEESVDGLASMWNVLTLQSWASVLVKVFTSKPHMSAIFDIARHLSWEKIQKDWSTKLGSKYSTIWKEDNAERREE